MNRKRDQLVSAAVSSGNREQEQGNTSGPGRPARPPQAIIVRRQPPKQSLICRCASESVFPGILDQIFRGFIDFEIVFSDAEVWKI